MTRWFRDFGWRHVVGFAALVFALFPLVFVISASLNPRGTLTASVRLFADASLDNYRALGDIPYTFWFVNTLWIAGATAVATVLLAASGAYAFSRFRFRGRRLGMLGLLLVQMFPQILAAVAIFLLMAQIKGALPGIGLGTQWGLVMVYLGGAMGVNIFLIKGFFDSIPRELDDAAKVDGASHARVFFTIILRLGAPVLAVIALLSFIATVNEFMIASIMLQDPERKTLAVGLYGLVSEQLSANWGAFSAGALLGALPSVLLFRFLQRYIVSGLLRGSVKG
ncbi:sugar ABC transporter permease [Nonomuraea soli]|uniref:Arabinogalactan oligomer/maltooligosaccharide transport system permease protein n=1 Tax=Nonomuraea soli TaxID=1032476 RepID=A0A7W0CQZ3_9ACTN|nr:ABC transporter permease subunit [Nonomuraea soli]MBA2895738.1 arabinogalactan oligomer/maltooligosaccharide transport system permease protein [Nonomuraea soli]